MIDKKQNLIIPYSAISGYGKVIVCNQILFTASGSVPSHVLASSHINCASSMLARRRLNNNHMVDGNVLKNPFKLQLSPLRQYLKMFQFQLSISNYHYLKFKKKDKSMILFQYIIHYDLIRHYRCFYQINAQNKSFPKHYIITRVMNDILLTVPVFNSFSILLSDVTIMKQNRPIEYQYQSKQPISYFQRQHEIYLIDQQGSHVTYMKRTSYNVVVFKGSIFFNTYIHNKMNSDIEEFSEKSLQSFTMDSPMYNQDAELLSSKNKSKLMLNVKQVLSETKEFFNHKQMNETKNETPEDSLGNKIIDPIYLTAQLPFFVDESELEETLSRKLGGQKGWNIKFLYKQLNFGRRAGYDCTRLKETKVKICLSKKLYEQFPKQSLTIISKSAGSNYIFFKPSQSRSELPRCMGILRHEIESSDFFTTKHFLHWVSKFENPTKIRAWMINSEATMLEITFQSSSLMNRFIKKSQKARFKGHPIVPFKSSDNEQIEFAAYLMKRKISTQLSPQVEKEPKIRRVEDVVSEEHVRKFALELQQKRNFPPLDFQ